jgi:release factor glutamine methyltransferase
MHRTVSEALAYALERLEGLPHARTDADELVSRLIGVRRGDLPFRGTRRLSAVEDDTLERWLARRAGGWPVQYVTGRAAFRSLDLMVDPRVLVPRPETEWLVECVLDVLRAEAAAWPEPRVLDLGTGSGAIALAVAQEWPAAIVTATDASEGALAVARENAEAAGLAGRVRFLHGDWFGALDPDERFDAIVSNPPYIACAEAGALPDDVRLHEPGSALFGGADGLDDVRTLLDDAPRHLVADGLLALELAEQRAAEVAAWLDGAHDWRDVRLVDDLAGRPRVLLARRERGPAIAPAQWREPR